MSRVSATSAAGTSACSSTSSVLTIRKSGAPSSYDAPSVANTSATRPAIGARRTKALPDAAPPPVRSVSSRCARRASAACSRASATRDGAPRLLDAPRRHGALGEQPLGARLFGARGLGRGLRLGHVGGERRPVVAGRQPRLEPAERLARADRRADRDQRVGGEAAGRRRGDDRLAAGHRLDDRPARGSTRARRPRAPARWRTRWSTAVPSGRRSPRDRPRPAVPASATAAA